MSGETATVNMSYGNNALTNYTVPTIRHFYYILQVM